MSVKSEFKMSETEHTPTPWYTKPTAGHEIHGQTAVYGENGKTIAIVYDGAKDAAIIERAVNNHADLLNALQAFIDLWPVRGGDIKATPEVRVAWRNGREALRTAMHG